MPRIHSSNTSIGPASNIIILSSAVKATSSPGTAASARPVPTIAILKTPGEARVPFTGEEAWVEEEEAEVEEEGMQSGATGTSERAARPMATETSTDGTTRGREEEGSCQGEGDWTGEVGQEDAWTSPLFPLGSSGPRSSNSTTDHPPTATVRTTTSTTSIPKRAGNSTTSLT